MIGLLPTVDARTEAMPTRRLPFLRLAVLAGGALALFLLSYPALYARPEFYSRMGYPRPDQALAQLEIAASRLRADLRRRLERRVEKDVASSGAGCHAFLRHSPLVDRDPPRAVSPQVHEIMAPLKPAPRMKETNVSDPAPVEWYAPSGGPKPPNRIFFLSKYNSFPRDESLCALEAAAHANPEHEIMVFTPNPADLEERVLEVFGDIDPSFVSRFATSTVHDEELFKGTPFDEWYQSGRYKESEWVSQNLGNAARLAILWKDGGTYFDLDMLAINPLSGATRAMAVQDHDFYFLNNAVMTFPPKDPWIWALMEEFAGDFNGYIWGYQGPFLLSRVFRKKCPVMSYEAGVSDKRPAASQVDPPLCKGLTVFDTAAFYGVSLYVAEETFPQPWRDRCDVLEQLDQRAVALHLWHNAFRGVEFDKNDLHTRILERACPYYTRAQALAQQSA